MSSSNSGSDAGSVDMKAPENSAAPAEQRSVVGYKWVLLLLAVYSTAFVYGLDTTIAADIQAPIVVEFGNPEMVAWLGNGFALGNVATILYWGKLFSRVDMKYLFLVSIVIFEVGSAICGAATSMNMEVGGRVIAGIGGSGIYLGCLNIVSALTTTKERGVYISGIGATWGAGCVLGPILGGLFTESSATWRWSFYINLVIAAACIPLYIWYIPSMPSEDPRSLLQRVGKVDYLGFFLSAAAWVLFSLLFTFAGALWEYNAPQTIACAVLFGAFTILFVLQQRFALLTSKAERLFPAHLLLSRTQLTLVFACSGVQAGLFVPLYYLPLYFQFAKGDSALDAAVHILPFIIVNIVVNLGIGILLPYVNFYAAAYLVAGALVALGGGLLHIITVDTSLSMIYGFSVLASFGSGLCEQMGYTVAAVKLTTQGRTDEINAAISLQNVTQIGTSLILLVICGQIFQKFAAQEIGTALANLNLSNSQIHSAVSGSESAIYESLNSADKAKVTVAVTSAIGLVYFVIVAFGIMTVLASLGMRWERLFQKAPKPEEETGTVETSQQQEKETAA